MILKPSSVGREYLTILFVSFVAWILNLILLSVLFSLFSADFGTSWNIRLQMTVQSITLFFLPAVFLHRYYSCNGKKYIEGIKVKPSLNFLMISLLMILLTIPVVYVISFVINEILASSLFSSLDLCTRDEYLKDIYDRLLLSSSPIEICANIIVIAVVPAICEEFFFRGVVQNFMLRNIENKNLSIFLSSAVFSLVHFQASEFVSRLVLGFVIGYAYFKSKSLWIPILMHALNNIIAILFYTFR